MLTQNWDKKNTQPVTNIDAHVVFFPLERLKATAEQKEEREGGVRWGGRESHGKQSGCCHMVHVCRLSRGEEEFWREVCVRSEKPWCILSCSPINKLKNCFDQKANDGNPCHKSKGECAVYLIVMLNVACLCTAFNKELCDVVNFVAQCSLVKPLPLVWQLVLETQITRK